MINIINKKEINFFKKNGYILLKNILDKDFHNNVIDTFIDINKLSLLKSSKLGDGKKFKNKINELDYYTKKQFNSDKEIFEENLKLLKKTYAINEILINKNKHNCF